MDDSTQDRAAHTPMDPFIRNDALHPYQIINPFAEDFPIELQWKDSDGNARNYETKFSDLCRMADSHADLLAALEACLPWVHSTMAVANQARAALAKAKVATP